MTFSDQGKALLLIKHNLFKVRSCAVKFCVYLMGLAPKLSPGKSLKLMLKCHLSWQCP